MKIIRNAALYAIGGAIFMAVWGQLHPLGNLKGWIIVGAVVAAVVSLAFDLNRRGGKS